MADKVDKETLIVGAMFLALFLSLPLAAVAAYRFFGWPGFLRAAGPALGFAAAIWLFARLIGENSLEACVPAYIVCALMLIAVRKGSELHYRTAEGTAKGHLDRLRSEAERGRWPGEWPAIAAPPFHPKSSARLRSETPDDAGGWRVTPSSQVYVNCTHTDVRGRVWHSY